jgi:hypothetical protein
MDISHTMSNVRDSVPRGKKTTQRMWASVAYLCLYTARLYTYWIGLDQI